MSGSGPSVDQWERDGCQNVMVAAVDFYSVGRNKSCAVPAMISTTLRFAGKALLLVPAYFQLETALRWPSRSKGFTAGERLAQPDAEKVKHH